MTELTRCDVCQAVCDTALSELILEDATGKGIWWKHICGSCEKRLLRFLDDEARPPTREEISD